FTSGKTYVDLWNTFPSAAKLRTGQHMQRGATKEKTRKLDELKAKRRAKDESRKRVRPVLRSLSLCFSFACNRQSSHRMPIAGLRHLRIWISPTKNLKMVSSREVIMRRKGNVVYWESPRPE